MNNASLPKTLPEPANVALRCYTDNGSFALHPGSERKMLPSRWTLVFDTETRTDAAQNIRFGTYQVREGDRLHEAGIFCDEQNLAHS